MLLKLSKKHDLFEASKNIDNYLSVENLEFSLKHSCHIIIDCAKLSSLRKLYIYAQAQCKLTLSNAQELEILKLKGVCNLQELAGSHLKNLKILQLANCNLTILPNWCVEQSKLESLELQNNQLTTLPNEFEWLKELRRLNIDNNKFEQVPRVLATIEKLHHLSCDNNEITDENLYEFRRLKNS
ncbi:leucine-rich repeat domain-containing protein [Halobacteriovorax sp. DA5]|uniref:leucine-rich repeat domain-containing protein n=1 Tax=Halobacteriovorax sp. DA5 TaxID=2067553 RepID=UPI000CD120BA|nr:leucine-rich repeat domain-containing protein [Halobacteriovorax sp. DA5]POB14336.1 hypothetical protein C0Z22_04390 [Halobacteriovorax sp. DA5]